LAAGAIVVTARAGATRDAAGCRKTRRPSSRRLRGCHPCGSAPLRNPWRRNPWRF